MPGKMHAIFMAIDFHTFLHAIIWICVISVAPRIARPHIPFGLAFGQPFSQHFAGAAALRDAKGKDAGLKRVGHAGHWPDQRHSIWRVGDGPVDYF